jgi:hypothetical protein
MLKPSNPTFDRQRDLEFRQADKAIERSATRIASEVKALLARLPLNHVGPDRVIERLGAEIIKRNPELLDLLNGIEGYTRRGPPSVRLAEALADWRDAGYDR